MKIHLAFSVHTYRLNYCTNMHKIWYCTRAGVLLWCIFLKKKAETEKKSHRSTRVGILNYLHFKEVQLDVKQEDILKKKEQLYAK